MGALCDSVDAVQFNPLCWFAANEKVPLQPVSTSLANQYEAAQYGKIPNPVAAPPSPPSIDVQTNTPQAVWLDIAKSINANTAAATDAGIQNAIDTGVYNPTGNLPFSATDVSDAIANPLGSGKSVLFWIAAGSIGLLVFSLAVKR